MGNSTSRDGVAAVAAQLANVALGKEDVHSFEMEAMPMELWEVIFNFTEDKTLAIAVPRINRYTRNLAHPNCGIWRAKCKSKGIEAPNENTTWKKRYFAKFQTIVQTLTILFIVQFKMFPLLGHLIGEATYDQLLRHPGATAGTSGSSRYVTIDKHNFWVDDKGIFTHMYIARGIYPIPKEWEDFGITWNRSWRDYKDLIKKWNGNYEVETAPHLSLFDDRRCFTARLTSVARYSEKLYYQIDLSFDYTEGNLLEYFMSSYFIRVLADTNIRWTGNEESSGTLYSISVMVDYYSQNFDKTYQEQRLVERPWEEVVNAPGIGNSQVVTNSDDTYEELVADFFTD